MSYIDELMSELGPELTQDEKEVVCVGPWAEQYEERLEQQDKDEL